jgi:hypothetical protein
MRGLLAFSKSEADTFRHCAGATGAKIMKSDSMASGYIGIREPMMYPGSLTTGIYTDGITATELLEANYPDAVNEDGTMKDNLQKHWDVYRKQDSAYIDIHVMKLSLGWFRVFFLATVQIMEGRKNDFAGKSETSGQFCLGFAAARKQPDMWDQIQEALDGYGDSYAFPFNDTEEATNAMGE